MGNHVCYVLHELTPHTLRVVTAVSIRLRTRSTCAKIETLARALDWLASSFLMMPETLSRSVAASFWELRGCTQGALCQ